MIKMTYYLLHIRCSYIQYRIC